VTRRPRLPKNGADALAMFRAMTDTPAPESARPERAPIDWRGHMSNLLDIAGMAGVVAGVSLVYIPAAVILGGLFCVLLGWKIDRGR
jgi:hypothetical protein